MLRCHKGFGGYRSHVERLRRSLPDPLDDESIPLNFNISPLFDDLLLDTTIVIAYTTISLAVMMMFLILASRHIIHQRKMDASGFEPPSSRSEGERRIRWTTHPLYSLLFTNILPAGFEPTLRDSRSRLLDR